MIQIGKLLFIILIYTLIIFISKKKIQDFTYKLAFIFFVATFGIFCGIGTAYSYISVKYLFMTTIYITVFSTTFIFLYRRISAPKTLSDSTCIMVPTSFESWGIGVYRIIAFMFLFTYFIYLLIPNVRLSDIFTPPAPTLVDWYTRQRANESNVILSIASSVRTLLFPFFMIFLSKSLEKNKVFRSILWIIAWVYLDYLSKSYLGRYEMVLYSCFLIFVISPSIRKTHKLKFKTLLIIAIVFIVSMPFLNDYVSIRLNDNVSSTSSINKILDLISGEIQTTQYYDASINIGNKFILFLRWIWYFLALPFPSALVGEKLSINRLFSETILGVSYGSSGYYGKVPSLFGESLILCGPIFFVIHAIIVASMIIVFLAILKKYKNMDILSMYYCLSLITISRGGTQGYFASALYVILILYISSVLTNRKQHPLNKLKGTQK